MPRAPPAALRLEDGALYDYSPTAEDCFWAPDSDFPSRRPRKRASIPELLVSEKSGGLDGLDGLDLHYSKLPREPANEERYDK